MKLLIAALAFISMTTYADTITVSGAVWQVSSVEVAAQVNEMCKTATDIPGCKAGAYKLLGKVGRTYAALDACDINGVNSVECKEFELVVNTIADKE